MLRKIRLPTAAGSREAPMTATVRGCSNGHERIRGGNPVTQFDPLAQRSQPAGGEGHVNAAAVVSLVHLEPGVAKNVDHGLIFVQHFGFEADKAMSGCDARQPFQKQGADAAALVRVLDYESHFRFAADARRNIVAYADDADVRFLVDDGQQRQTSGRVIAAEHVDNAARHIRHRAHEPHLQALGGQALQERFHRRDIVLGGRTEAYAFPVPEQYVFPEILPFWNNPKHGQPTGQIEITDTTTATFYQVSRFSGENEFSPEQDIYGNQGSGYHSRPKNRMLPKSGSGPGRQ